MDHRLPLHHCGMRMCVYVCACTLYAVYLYSTWIFNYKCCCAKQMSKWFGGEDADFCKLNCKIKKYFYKDVEQISTPLMENSWFDLIHISCVTISDIFLLQQEKGTLDFFFQFLTMFKDFN